LELGPLGFSVGVAGGAPWDWQIGPAGVRVIRVPVDASLRLVGRAGRVAVAADAGPLCAWIHISGHDIPDPSGGPRLQCGGRAGLMVRADLGVVSPFVAVWGEWAVPRYAVAVPPDGPVGEIPPLWVGIALGIAARVH
jgi:hypothetical protein